MSVQIQLAICLAMALYIGTSFLLRNLSGKLVLTISVIIALFVGYDKSINDFLVLSSYFVFFPFYWAGIFYKIQILWNL